MALNATNLENAIMAKLVAGNFTETAQNREFVKAISEAIIDEVKNGDIKVVFGTTAQPTPPTGGAVAVPDGTTIGSIE